MSNQNHKQNGCEVDRDQSEEAGVGLCGLLSKKKVTEDGGQNDQEKKNVITSSDAKHDGPLSTLADHLHRSDDTSSSEEEEEEEGGGGGEKKRKKKGLKEKIKKKMSIEKEAEVTIEIMHEEEEEEKKGFMEKIMDKLPVRGNDENKLDSVEIESEKVGMLDKIKEKIQGGINKVNGDEHHERKKED
ncbi:hypothetical protein LINGRAHAP2_LOCUS12643 [Linum grandiflorum]